MKKMQTVKITRAEADKAKPHHDVLKDLAKEKKQALKIMGITYETSREPQTEVEELYKRAYSHLGRWQHCSGCESNEPHIDNTCCVCGSKNKPLALTVTAEGLTYDDLSLALEEIKKQLDSEYVQGSNSNDTGKYHFTVKV